MGTRESAPFDPEGEMLEAEALTRGAVRGVSVLALRSLALQGVTAFATIALARLLTPEDYGAYAVALAISLLSRTAVEVGLPVAFIRRAQYPSLREQRALTGFMLLAGGLITAVVVPICFLVLP